MAQLTFSTQMDPKVPRLRPAMYAPIYASQMPAYRPPPSTLVIAPSAPARTLGATPEYVEPDLFLIAQGLTCEAWDGMVVESQRERIAQHYGIATASPIVTAFLSKYRGRCAWQPGRALAALGLACAQWQRMSASERVTRLMLYASPLRTAAPELFAAYADAVTGYCAGAMIAPGGQVQTPELVEPLANKLTFWRITTVVFAGTTIALWLKTKSRKR